MNQIKNFLLTILNVAALATVMPILEYDLSKSLKPGFDWLPTYRILDLILISIVSIVAIYNIAILFLVIVRSLNNHRRWLWLATVLIWMVIGFIVLLLGKSFLPIYFPGASF